MSRPNPQQLIAGLAHGRVSLELKTIDLCFLAALHLRADRAGLSAFEEEELLELFEQVCDSVEPGAENPRKRATHAIQRLREQRMLTRVDGAGVLGRAEYALTRLAAAIVGHFITEETLTRESLGLLTATLRGQLAEVLASAKKAATPAEWNSAVVARLGVTVSDLFAGIERRQRGLDAQQEEVQAEIGRLLAADWFGAIDRCQALLDTTTTTLRELNEILLGDTHHFVAQLQEIQALATTATHEEAEAEAQHVIEQVDRIGQWGSARQRAWSDYYQHVHRFLRDVVRLDPDRALSQRLRDQVGRWRTAPFYVQVTDEPSHTRMREIEPRVERPPVLRAHVNRAPALEEVDTVDAIAALEALIHAALDHGATTLAEITSWVLPRLDPGAAYVAIGRVAEALPRLRRVRVDRERPWRPVDERLEIEDWEIAAKELAR